MHTHGPCVDGMCCFLTLVWTHELIRGWNCIELNTHPHRSTNKTGEPWIWSVDGINVWIRSYRWNKIQDTNWYSKINNKINPWLRYTTGFQNVTFGEIWVKSKQDLSLLLCKLHVNLQIYNYLKIKCWIKKNLANLPVDQSKLKPICPFQGRALCFYQHFSQIKHTENLISCLDSDFCKNTSLNTDSVPTKEGHLWKCFGV